MTKEIIIDGETYITIDGEAYITIDGEAYNELLKLAAAKLKSDLTAELFPNYDRVIRKAKWLGIPKNFINDELILWKQ